MPKVVLAGGSGFIGTALCRALIESGREVVVLSRTGKAPQGARGVAWDARTLGEWAKELAGAEAVVNLTGAPISCRWTAEARREIIGSRVESSTILGQAISDCAIPPRAWINASAVGVYGNSGPVELEESVYREGIHHGDTEGHGGARRGDTEGHGGTQRGGTEGVGGHGDGFLAEVCAAWENAVDRAPTSHTRKVKLRIGFVLARDGGALPVLVKLVRAFLGGAAGNGRQYVSWIHLQDLVALILWQLDCDLDGPVNATAPNPVTNAELTAALRKALRRPWSPPVPALVLRVVGKVFGPDAALVLQGQRAIPRKALDGGFTFRFPDVHLALADLL